MPGAGSAEPHAPETADRRAWPPAGPDLPLPARACCARPAGAQTPRLGASRGGRGGCHPAGALGRVFSQGDSFSPLCVARREKNLSREFCAHGGIFRSKRGPRARQSASRAWWRFCWGTSGPLKPLEGTLVPLFLLCAHGNALCPRTSASRLMRAAPRGGPDHGRGLGRPSADTGG